MSYGFYLVHRCGHYHVKFSFSMYLMQPNSCRNLENAIMFVIRQIAYELQQFSKATKRMKLTFVCLPSELPSYLGPLWIPRYFSPETVFSFCWTNYIKYIFKIVSGNFLENFRWLQDC